MSVFSRRQMLVLKVPQIAAPDYMEQVGAALTKVLTRTPPARGPGVRTSLSPAYGDADPQTALALAC